VASRAQLSHAQDMPARWPIAPLHLACRKSFVAAGLVSVASAGLRGSSEGSSEFDAFLATYNKPPYASAEEYNHRLGIYTTNVAAFAAHNEAFARGEVSYTKGVNQWADLTGDEWRALMFRGRVTRRVASTDAAPALQLSSRYDALPAAVNWTAGTPAGFVADVGVKDQGQCGVRVCGSVSARRCGSRRAGSPRASAGARACAPRMLPSPFTLSGALCAPPLPLVAPPPCHSRAAGRSRLRPPSRAPTRSPPTARACSRSLSSRSSAATRRTATMGACVAGARQRRSSLAWPPRIKCCTSGVSHHASLSRAAF